MGVTGLCNLIEDIVPVAVSEKELKSYFGRRIAVDASIFLYQFLIAIQFSNQENTRILSGFFNRTCKMLEHGIKPVFVFDGKPPDMKLETLKKRKEKVTEAKTKLGQLNDDNDDDLRSQGSSQGSSYGSQRPIMSSQIDFKVVKQKDQRDPEQIKWSKRSVRMDGKHVLSAKTLLRLLGVPVIDAPAEAESLCAQLCKDGLVYGVATEDVDVLVFGAPKMIRHMSGSATEKMKEIDLKIALEGLKITQEQLVDLSILIGCDYCPSIKGIGPKKGLKLLQSMNKIEKILKEKFGIEEKEETDDEKDEEKEEVAKDGLKEEVAKDDSSDGEWEKTLKITTSKRRGVNKSKKTSKVKEKVKDSSSVPTDWKYKEARGLFLHPDVTIKSEINESLLKINDPDEDGIIDFLCSMNQFDVKRVRAALDRIKNGKKKSTQSRIDCFFKKVASTQSSSQSSCLSQLSQPSTSSSQESVSSCPPASTSVNSDDDEKTTKLNETIKIDVTPTKKKKTKKRTVKTKVIRFKTKPTATKSTSDETKSVNEPTATTSND